MWTQLNYTSLLETERSGHKEIWSLKGRFSVAEKEEATWQGPENGMWELRVIPGQPLAKQ